METSDFLIKTKERMILCYLGGGDSSDGKCVDLASKILETKNQITSPIKKTLLLLIKNGYSVLPEILNKLSEDDKKIWGEKAISSFLKKNWINNAKNVADILKRELSDDELITSIKDFLENENQEKHQGKHFDQENLISMFKLVKSKEATLQIFDYIIDNIKESIMFIELQPVIKFIPPSFSDKRTTVIKKMINYCFKKLPWLVDYEIKLNELLPPLDAQINWPLIRSLSIKNGLLHSAQKIALLTKESLSKDELNKILNVHKENRNYEGYTMVCGLLGIEFSLKDKINFISKDFQNKKIQNQEKNINFLFPDEKDSEVRLSFLKQLMCLLLNYKMTQNALKFVERLPEEDAANYLKQIIKIELKNLEKCKSFHSNILNKSLSYLELVTQ